MKPSAFDAWAADYDAHLMRGLAFSGEGREFFARGRIEVLRRWWQDNGRPPPRSILDFGCGDGSTARLLADAFPEAEVTGLDPSCEMIERADSRFASERIRFRSLDPGLPLPTAPVDLLYLSGVLHHVPVPDRPALLLHLAAALGPRGVLAVFENNPLNPGTRLVMSRIPFDHDAVTLRPGELQAALREAGLRILFTGSYFYFPRLLRWLRPLERGLVRLPLGAQYGVLAEAGASPGGGATAAGERG